MRLISTSRAAMMVFRSGIYVDIGPSPSVAIERGLGFEFAFEDVKIFDGRFAAFITLPLPLAAASSPDKGTEYILHAVRDRLVMLNAVERNVLSLPLPLALPGDGDAINMYKSGRVHTTGNAVKINRYNLSSLLALAERSVMRCSCSVSSRSSRLSGELSSAVGYLNVRRRREVVFSIPDSAMSWRWDRAEFCILRLIGRDGRE